MRSPNLGLLEALRRAIGAKAEKNRRDDGTPHGASGAFTFCGRFFTRRRTERAGHQTKRNPEDKRGRPGHGCHVQPRAVPFCCRTNPDLYRRPSTLSQLDFRTGSSSFERSFVQTARTCIFDSLAILFSEKPTAMRAQPRVTAVRVPHLSVSPFRFRIRQGPGRFFHVGPS